MGLVSSSGCDGVCDGGCDGVEELAPAGAAGGFALPDGVAVAGALWDCAGCACCGVAGSCAGGGDWSVPGVGAATEGRLLPGTGVAAGSEVGGWVCVGGCAGVWPKAGSVPARAMVIATVVTTTDRRRVRRRCCRRGREKNMKSVYWRGAAVGVRERGWEAQTIPPVRCRALTYRFRAGRRAAAFAGEGRG